MSSLELAAMVTADATDLQFVSKEDQIRRISIACMVGLKAACEVPTASSGLAFIFTLFKRAE